MLICVVTVSDRASRGEYEDRSGPEIEKLLNESFPDSTIRRVLVADEKDDLLRVFSENLDADFIITTGWLGDHMLPGPSPGYEVYTSDETPPPLIWTGYYYKGSAVAARIAAVLGRNADTEKYEALAQGIKEAFNSRFFDEESGNYASGSQTANAFPLVLGLIPEGCIDAVLDNLVREIMETHTGHIHTGHVGTASVLEGLMRHEEGEALYSLASAQDYPGWGYMVGEGATTIWESWGHDWASDMVPHRSHRADSMLMWGCIDKFFYHYLAGIGEPAYHGKETQRPGFSEIVIRPHVVGDLTSAQARIMTVKGIVTSSWRTQKGSIILDVVIPVNSRARVAIPKMGIEDFVVLERGVEVYQDGVFKEGAEGVLEGGCSSEFVELYIGSGSYSFTLEKIQPLR